MPPTWDLLIRSGTLIDPARSVSAKRDVAFSGSKVAAVAETLTGNAVEVIDATGAIVTPGLASAFMDDPRSAASRRSASYMSSGTSRT
jgi:predicted amidohydrolase